MDCGDTDAYYYRGVSHNPAPAAQVFGGRTRYRASPEADTGRTQNPRQQSAEKENAALGRMFTAYEW
jgi:hypothetical protein